MWCLFGFKDIFLIEYSYHIFLSLPKSKNLFAIKAKKQQKM